MAVETLLLKCWTFHISLAALETLESAYFSLFGQGNGILFRDIVRDFSLIIFDLLELLFWAEVPTHQLSIHISGLKKLYRK